ncbi:MAG: M1 family metallopeptidase, partial [Spirochaetia bacterium]
MYSFQPHHYRLHFEPDFETSTFRGHTILTGACSEKCDSITLDAGELSIHSIVLNDAGTGGEALSLEYSADEAHQSLTIMLPHTCASMISLSIDYSGRIRDDLVGLYRATFTDAGRTRVMAITQFEEIDARRVFPCVDRPDAKARFDIEYRLPNGVEGIANTPIIDDRAVESSDAKGNKHLVRFETTPVMSTYLLFFGMGPFEFEVDHDWRIPIRVAARPGQARYGREAIRWTQEALRFGEEYTGIAFPIRKMDLIACPDFAFGARENYGAITFRENRLLIYPGRTPASEFERICQITNHEVAHMWFGNLVTPRDWSYIWLNEAFATYFGYVITDTFHPEFEGLDHFIASQMDVALSRDGLQSTVPVEFPDGRELEFSPATTPIIYRKAGCILRMMRLYLGDCGIAEASDGDATVCAEGGPDCGEAPSSSEGDANAPFRAGVRAFLNDYRESSADTDGFLASFTRGVNA